MTEKADLSATESKTHFFTSPPQSNLCSCHKRLHSTPEVDQCLWNVSEAQNYDGFPFFDPDKSDPILCQQWWGDFKHIETSFLTRRKADSDAHDLVGNELLKTEEKEQSVSDCSTVLGLFSPRLGSMSERSWLLSYSACRKSFQVGFCIKTLPSGLGHEEAAISQECHGISPSTPHPESITTQASCENL